MKEPVRILSDLHLAHPASLIHDVEQLRPLIDGAGTVIFNGDTRQDLALDLQGHSSRLYHDLVSLCQELGAEPVFLPGNHDPQISETKWIELLDRKIAVFHGDVIYPAVSPWSRYYLDQRDKIDALIAEHWRDSLSLDERYDLAHAVVNAMKPARQPLKTQSRWQYYANTLWPPKRLWTLATIKQRAKRQAESFVAEYFPHARVAVYGHFHLPLVHGDQTNLLNTGAFMAGCQSVMVEVKEGSVACFQVLRKPDESFIYKDQSPTKMFFV